MKLEYRRLVLAAVVSLATGVTGAAAIQLEPSAAEIVVRLSTNTLDGPTQVAGHAATIIRAGEMGGFQIAAGVTSDREPRCAVTTLAGGSAPALVGPGYRWRVSVELEEIRGDRFHLRIDWQRSGRLADGGDAARSEEVRVRLAAGESRHLDYAEFRPIEGDGTCNFAALVLEIEPRVRVGNPAWSGRDLSHEIWFRRSHRGATEESTHLRMVGAQGEPMAFPIEPLDLELELGATARGQLRSGGRGTLTAWLTGRDTVAIRLEAIIQHRFDPSGVRVSSGEGSKLYEARLGETVEIELPPLYASLIVPAAGLGISGPPAPGVELEGEQARLDLRRLTGERSYSLMLRVTEAR